MPLLKRKPFTLLEPPEDLRPSELIYQVRFTKEIFCDYREYLNRINLYRQRVWTCKVTGKGSLTYEEALVSEKHATEKLQQFPKELVAPVLQIVQFSTLTLRDLVRTINLKVREQLFVGIELYGKKDKLLYPCKILKIVKDDDETHYEVAWLDDDKKVIGKAVLNEDDLIQKKLPYSRDVLESFIRESTCQNCPWVVHDNLARIHGISTSPPEELVSDFIFQNGHLVRNKKRKIEDDGQNNSKKKKAGRGDDGETEVEHSGEEAIKYPIDDLLVPCTEHDSGLATRPSPSRDFNVPMSCVGDLLMVWDFFSSFGRLLNLSTFSLEYFENAVCHKDSNPVLIVECHATIFRFLIKDGGDYFIAMQKKKRKSKITLLNWAEYLADFLELIDIPELSTYIATIKRGHYSLLDVHAKLDIFRELVGQAVSTNMFREKVDDNVEQRQALGATRRGEALEEGRRRREKERLKTEPNGNIQALEGSNSSDNNNQKQNGDSIERQSKARVSPGKKQALGNSEEKHANGAEGRMSKEQRKEYFEKEIAKLVIRSSPLGRDRDYNRYWFFRRNGTVFVESSDFKQWGYYNSKEEIDALMGSMNCKGVRERALHMQLSTYYPTICAKLQKGIRREAAQRSAGEDSVVRRSTRVRAPPRNNPALAFLKYVNKWKEELY